LVDIGILSQGGDMEKLSSQLQLVFDFIWQYNEERGYCASIEDVSEGLGLSHSTVTTYIDELKNRGFLISKDGISRSLIAIPVN
jgi:Mn-dependent DtxR family transcriptional regulator